MSHTFSLNIIIHLVRTLKKKEKTKKKKKRPGEYDRNARNLPRSTFVSEPSDAEQIKITTLLLCRSQESVVVSNPKKQKKPGLRARTRGRT